MSFDIGPVDWPKGTTQALVLGAAMARARVMADDLAEQFRAIGFALVNAAPADPDEPLWFRRDAVRPRCERGVDAMSDDTRDAMTGPEHYAEALRLLAYAPDIVMSRVEACALAQVHAALAVAATFGTETAFGPTSSEMRETRAQWAAVLGLRP